MAAEENLPYLKDNVAYECWVLVPTMAEGTSEWVKDYAINDLGRAKHIAKFNKGRPNYKASVLVEVSQTRREIEYGD